MRTFFKLAALAAAVLASHFGGAAFGQSIAPGGVYAGAGAYYIKPNWSTNPAYSLAPGGGIVVQEDFDYDLSLAPLMWMGISDACTGLGVQARGWYYEDDANLALANPGGGFAVESATPLGFTNTSTTAGDQLAFTSTLEIDVIDVLGTLSRQYGMFTAQAGAGVRYARVDQEYAHTEVPVNNLVDAVASESNFDGLGPTLALESRIQLTSGLSFLGDLRYSLLFGESEQSAVNIVDNNLAGVRHQQNDAVLSIFEVELGGEYVRPVGRAQLFLQGAFVAQFWDGVGNSSNSDVVIVNVDPETSDKNADLGLIGFRAAGGVRF